MHDLARNCASDFQKTDSSFITVQKSNIENNTANMEKVCSQSRPQTLPLSEVSLQDLNSPFTVVGADGTVMSTPTPTQFLFPKKVTEEQEEFTRGFDEALKEIYRRNTGDSKPTDKQSEASTRSDTSNSSWTESSISHNSRNNSPYTGGRMNGDIKSHAINFAIKSENDGLVPPSVAVSSSLANGFKVENSICDINATYSSNDNQHLYNNCTQSIAFNGCNVSTVKTYTNLDTRSIQVQPPFQHIPCAPYTGTTVNHTIVQSAPRDMKPTAGRPRMTPNGGNNFIKNQPYPSNNTHSQIPGAFGANMQGAMPTVSGSAWSHGGTRLPRALDRHHCDPYPVTTIKMEEDIDITSRLPRPGGALDPEEQERLKLERKRAKNRIAAQRCQARKVEKIARLEDKVMRLREQNTSLGDTIRGLHRSITELRNQISCHVERGCRLMLPSLNLSQLPN